MTLGISSIAVKGLSGLSKKLKKADGADKFVIKDPHITRLIGNLSKKSGHISP